MFQRNRPVKIPERVLGKAAGLSRLPPPALVLSRLCSCIPCGDTFACLLSPPDAAASAASPRQGQANRRPGRQNRVPARGPGELDRDGGCSCCACCSLSLACGQRLGRFPSALRDKQPASSCKEYASVTH